MAEGRYNLHRYRNLVNRCLKPLRCQFCSRKFSARELENHLFGDHRYRFPSINSCPWCAGNRSWRRAGQKNRHARHLTDCFKRYRKHFEWTGPEPPICEAREMYGRSTVLLHPRAYESAFLPPPYDPSRDTSLAWWRLKEDQQFIESDDLGIAYVRKFIQFEGSAVGWFHLIVRACALGEFFERFEEYVDPADDSRRHRAFLLEFSCWCDGGERYDDPVHRHHRHMIVVARNGKEFYDQCWKKVVVVGGLPVDNYRYKLCYKIRSWKHLKNTLFCVSSRTSSCDFGDVSEEENEGTPRSSNHFYVFRPVTPRFKLRAALALDGVEGIREMITSLEGQRPVTSFARKCSRGTGRWRVKIGDVIDPRIERFLYQPNGMYFEKSTREYFESAKRDWWYPPSNQQRILDEVVPLVREIESARRYRNELEKRLESQKAESRQRESELKKQLKEQKVDLNRERAKYDKLMDAFLKSLDAKSKLPFWNDDSRGRREIETGSSSEQVQPLSIDANDDARLLEKNE